MGDKRLLMHCSALIINDLNAHALLSYCQFVKYQYITADF